MKFKRITIISGHYGSGKTNIALNLSLDLKKQAENTAIADIDIVNPYFRTKDSEELLASEGIRLICSDYANTNVRLRCSLFRVKHQYRARMVHSRSHL